jgi:hypothetical protein
MKPIIGLACVTAKDKEIRIRGQKQPKDCRLKCKQGLPEPQDRQYSENTGHKETTKTGYHHDYLVHSHPTKTHHRRADDPRKQKERRVTHTYHFIVNGKPLRCIPTAS